MYLQYKPEHGLRLSVQACMRTYLRRDIQSEWCIRSGHLSFLSWLQGNKGNIQEPQLVLLGI